MLFQCFLQKAEKSEKSKKITAKYMYFEIASERWAIDIQLLGVIQLAGCVYAK